MHTHVALYSLSTNTQPWICQFSDIPHSITSKALSLEMSFDDGKWSFLYSGLQQSNVMTIVCHVHLCNFAIQYTHRTGKRMLWFQLYTHNEGQSTWLKIKSTVSNIVRIHIPVYRASVPPMSPVGKMKPINITRKKKIKKQLIRIEIRRLRNRQSSKRNILVFGIFSSFSYILCLLGYPTIISTFWMDE